MFGSFETPTRSGTWPRYKPSTQTPPFTFSPTQQLFTQLEQSCSPPSSSHNLDSPFVFRERDSSSVHPPSLPALDASGASSSPMQMSTFPDTPSPPGHYGINGSLLVAEPASISMHSEGCQPIHPSHSDVFVSSKTQRPVLRPSFSHNSVAHTPSPSTWPRRVMASSALNNGDETGLAERARPPTAGTIMSTTPFATPSEVQQHEVSSSASFPVPSISTSSSSHPTQQQQPQPSYQPFSISTPYSDDLSSYGSTPYGSYDATYAAPSWPVTSFEVSHIPQYGLPPMQSYHKQDEPILMPGEIPAPRPSLSYAALIGEALLMAPPPHQLYVSEISDSIKKRYSYYRQNPTKIYNGVRHQTSMCKAFVKLPRPFGDQSGGARKWAIRAGCETWFHSGGYHPPGSNAPAKGGKNGGALGKAKATARSKNLALGITSPSMVGNKLVKSEYNPIAPPSYAGSNSAGPSSGPAYDPTRPSGYTTYAAPTPPGYLPPGYHYMPHNQVSQGMYVPVWGHSAAPPAPHPYFSSNRQESSPEQQRWPAPSMPYGDYADTRPLETRSLDGSHHSQEDLSFASNQAGDYGMRADGTISPSINGGTSSHGTSP